MMRVLTDLPLRTYASLPDGGKPSHAAVFFHGYGADGQDLSGISGLLRRRLPNAAFYFPDAPEELGFFGGYQWFDLDGFNPAELADPQGGAVFENPDAVGGTGARDDGRLFARRFGKRGRSGIKGRFVRFFAGRADGCLYGFAL